MQNRAGDNDGKAMKKVFHPFHFVLIALAGWMNQRQYQLIEYLREENRVLAGAGWDGGFDSTMISGGCRSVLKSVLTQLWCTRGTCGNR
jgi:hypothetical protein